MTFNHTHTLTTTLQYMMNAKLSQKRVGAFESQGHLMSKEGAKEGKDAYFKKHYQAYGMDRIFLLIKAICLELSPLSFLDSSLLVDTVYVYF